MENEMAEVPSEAHYGLSVARDPKKVLAEATLAAKALKDVISKKRNPVIFNGEQYLEFEDWQTVAKFYGVTARVVTTEYVEIGGAKGFLARAEAILISTGVVISGAESMCLNDEDKWTSRAKYEYPNGVKTKVGEVPVPMFQLRSMAQTRACAKCLRNVLAWVVVLAGYKPSVAEEMTGDEEPAAPKQSMPSRKSSDTGTQKQAAGVISKHFLPKGKSQYHSFTVEGYSDMYFQSSDKDTVDNLISHMETKDTVILDYAESQNGKFTNRIITDVAVQQGDAQDPT